MATIAPTGTHSATPVAATIPSVGILRRRLLTILKLLVLYSDFGASGALDCFAFDSCSVTQRKQIGMPFEYNDVGSPHSEHFAIHSSFRKLLIEQAKRQRRTLAKG
jgi:hypothetical protein